jgi:hypothetical protein
MPCAEPRRDEESRLLGGGARRRIEVGDVVDPQAMIRLVFRFVGLLFLAVALGWLTYDGIRSVAGDTAYTSIGSIWENIPQSERAALQSTVERLADVWHEVVQPYFLKQPVWLALAVIGAIGRKKKPPIEHAQD